ncbi:MAG: DMT family transporter [Candidimonas sp.]|nr:MAG: DMT family transporter [Candidimonas sp.]TAM24740.1 MAG: DMT family transporter [Candidimonas sp.]TAM80004.1 MAG: DMT family transporter [Candidimonas sp.]
MVARKTNAVVVLLAVLFVFIWSTGFIVGKAIVPYADPTLFLLVRVVIAALMFSGIALYARAQWPGRREIPKHLLAGVFLQGLYLSGTYWAIAGGLPPAIMALLGALQPILTAFLAIPVLKEMPTRRIWLGLTLGLVGVLLVIEPALSAGGHAAFSASVLLIALLAIASITIGTVLQKTSISKTDIRVSTALQNAGAVLFTAFFVWVRGEHRWEWSPQLWGSLLWASFVLSGVGTFLLVWIVRRGQAATASSLMFLAPPLAAVEAYFLFGDRLGPMQLMGFAIAIVGVVVCNGRR